MIESIEKLCPELDVTGLTQQVQRRAFDDGNVRVILAWPNHNANTAVAETRGACVVADYRPNGGARGIPQDARPVEIIRQLALNRAWVHEIVVRASRSELRAITRNSKDVIGVCARQRQRCARLNRRHARQRPTVQQSFEQSVRSARARQLIDVT